MGVGERFTAASSLGPGQLAASATALKNTPETVPGPPSSPTDQRLEGLEGPRVAGSHLLLATLSVGTLSAFSFCLDCYVWGALSADWKFMVPFNCGVHSLGLMACQAFLVGGVFVCVLVCETEPLPSGVQISVQ